MDKEETLKREVQNLLAGKKSSLSISKNIIYDKTAKQFVIKIPRELALAGGLTGESRINIVINPSNKELEESQKSHFIIYGKEKNQEEEK